MMRSADPQIQLLSECYNTSTPIARNLEEMDGLGIPPPKILGNRLSE